MQPQPMPEKERAHHNTRCHKTKNHLSKRHKGRSRPTLKEGKPRPPPVFGNRQEFNYRKPVWHSALTKPTSSTTLRVSEEAEPDTTKPTPEQPQITTEQKVDRADDIAIEPTTEQSQVTQELEVARSDDVQVRPIPERPQITMELEVDRTDDVDVEPTTEQSQVTQELEVDRSDDVQVQPIPERPQITMELEFDRTDDVAVEPTTEQSQVTQELEVDRSDDVAVQPIPEQPQITMELEVDRTDDVAVQPTTEQSQVTLENSRTIEEEQEYATRSRKRVSAADLSPMPRCASKTSCKRKRSSEGIVVLTSSPYMEKLKERLTKKQTKTTATTSKRSLIASTSVSYTHLTLPTNREV